MEIKTHLAESILALEYWLALKPEDAAAWCRLGTALLRKPDPASAEQSFSRARQFAPNEAWRSYFRSVEFFYSGRPKEAASAHANAKRLANREEGEAEWAELNLSLGKDFSPQELAALYGQLTVLAPERPALWQKLGFYLSRQNRYTQAAQAYRKAAVLDPEDASNYSALLWLLTLLGNLEERLAIYPEYLSRNPGDAKVWWEFAAALGWAGRHEEAREACRKVLELQPGHPEASKLLSQSGRSTSTRVKSLFHPEKRRKAERKPGAS